jgi:hypothetical protein
MTDEQFKALERLLRRMRSDVLELTCRVGELELHLRRQDEIASHRAQLVYEWCAPRAYKDAVQSISGIAETEMPDDLKAAIDELSRKKPQP